MGINKTIKNKKNEKKVYRIIRHSGDGTTNF